MTKHGQRRILLGVLGAVVLAVLVGLFGRARGTRAPEPTAPKPAPTASASAVAPDPLAPPAPSTASRLPSVGSGTPATAGGARGSIPPGGLARTTAAEYRRRARFPRSSQPLAEGDDPIARERSLSPISARGPRGEEPTITVMPQQVGFQAPDAAVLYAYLSVGERTLPAREVRASVTTENLTPVAELEYRDDGTEGDEVANDDVYTARFVPPAVDGEAPLSASYLVKVRAVTHGGEERLAATSFLYSAPWSELTGRFRDGLADGNLVVEAEIDVARAGRFHLEATLYSRDGSRALAWAQGATELEPGVHWIALPYYGLILREQGLDGPYLVRYAALSTTGQIPNAKNRVLEDAHLTGAYTATAFTDVPFNDPGLLDAADRVERDAGALAGLDAGG
jgi:hypothetical protein